MAEPEGNSEITGAVMKGAIAEGVLLVVGGVIFYTTGETAWLIGSVVVGSAIMVLLLAQAGAFTRR